MDTTIVAQGPLIEIGDTIVNVTASNGFVDIGSGTQVMLRGEFFYMDYGSLRVKWDATNVWEITLSENLAEDLHIKGLCGNYDGNPNSKSNVCFNRYMR